MSQIIARLRKNAFQEVWVTLGEWEGKNRIDIRIYVRGTEGPQPTRQGVSLPLDSYHDLKKAILQFEKCMDSNSPVVSFIKKDNEEVRISRGEFQGHQFVNIRVFHSDSGAMKPTRKGVTFNPNLFSEFKKAIMAINPLLKG